MVPRVVVIDDDVAITNALRRALAGDHEVTAFNDPHAALAALRAGAVFDVALVDYMMPRMSGLEVHRALAEIAPGLAAATVLMTGGSVPRDVIVMIASRRVANLAKPFDVEELRAAIDAVRSVVPDRRG